MCACVSVIIFIFTTTFSNYGKWTPENTKSEPEISSSGEKVNVKKVKKKNVKKATSYKGLALIVSFQLPPLCGVVNMS